MQNYAEITQNKNAIITQITQLLHNLRRITQINYANHYADYAIITLLNYPNKITQLPKMSLCRLRKYHFSSRRNSDYYTGATC